MVIFHSYVDLPEGTCHFNLGFMGKKTRVHGYIYMVLLVISSINGGCNYSEGVNYDDLTIFHPRIMVFKGNSSPNGRPFQVDDFFSLPSYMYYMV